MKAVQGQNTTSFVKGLFYIGAALWAIPFAWCIRQRMKNCK